MSTLVIVQMSFRLPYIIKGAKQHFLHGTHGLTEKKEFFL